MPKKYNNFQLNKILLLILLFIFLFLIFSWVRRYRYTSGKMSYQELKDFWEVGAYKYSSEQIPNKRYPEGYTTLGTFNIKIDDNLYNNVIITGNITRNIPNQKNIQVNEIYLFNYTHFSKQVHLEYKTSAGSYSNMAVTKKNKNTIKSYTDSFVNEGVGEENAITIWTFTKIKNGYSFKEIYSNNRGITWSPGINAKFTKI